MLCGYLCLEVTIGNFCEVLEDICGRAEITSDDREEAEWLSLSASDLRILVNEISSMRAKKLLQLVPVSTLARLLRVLDQQIHRAEGLSVEDCVRVSTQICSQLFTLFLQSFWFSLDDWLSLMVYKKSRVVYCKSIRVWKDLIYERNLLDCFTLFLRHSNGIMSCTGSEEIWFPCHLLVYLSRYREEILFCSFFSSLSALFPKFVICGIW